MDFPVLIDFQDLGSLLQFLRVCRPLDEPEFFRRHLTRPLSARSPEGAEVLKVGYIIQVKKKQLTISRH